MKRWRDQGLHVPYIAVNVAGRQLEHENFLETVIRTLEENGLQGDSLELEICENYIMRQPQQVIALLKKLQEFKVRIAIDDFGTGQTSLGQLKRIPIDTLKVDQSFVIISIQTPTMQQLSPQSMPWEKTWVITQLQKGWKAKRRNALFSARVISLVKAISMDAPWMQRH